MAGADLHAHPLVEELGAVGPELSRHELPEDQQVVDAEDHALAQRHGDGVERPLPLGRVLAAGGRAGHGRAIALRGLLGVRLRGHGEAEREPQCDPGADGSRAAGEAARIGAGERASVRAPRRVGSDEYARFAQVRGHAGLLLSCPASGP